MNQNRTASLYSVPNRFIRLITCLLTALLARGLLMGGAYAATQPAQATQPPEGAPNEVIAEDFDKGYWYYENTTDGIRIEIHRKRDEEKQIIWYEADLRCNRAHPLQFLLANPQRPGKGFAYPEVVMRTHQAVFGVNDDQFGHRMYNRKPVGIILRGGAVVANRTRPNGNRSWPTLDTAAFFADGTMQTFSSRAYTGEQYVEMGAETVLSFGPWLVQQGKINPLCAKHFRTREPRTALGMITPYHYIAITVEGRVQHSRGVGMQWLAERMLTLHVQEAINLDGGKTTALVFMGKVLKTNNPNGVYRKLRSVTGMIALGTSALVPAVDELGK